jgi:ribonuclease-3
MAVIFPKDPHLQLFVDEIDPEMLIEALAHKSWSFENGGRSYDRLEFIGDSILSVVVSLWLFEKYPEADEGRLTKLRQKYVSTENLDRIGKHYRLQNYLLVGVGMQHHQEQVSAKMFADVLEAVIAAHYLSTSCDRNTEFVRALLGLD